jgi:hypothetical protein
VKIGHQITLLAAVLAVSFFWPITTQVSGVTRIQLTGDQDAPLTGVRVRQSWGVYGYGGKGGLEYGTIDSAGLVAFPPRQVRAFLGMRALRRAKAFVTQCGCVIVFGHFGSRFTERWGPIVGHEVHLPPGRWLPAASPRGIDVTSPHFGDGPHRYISLHNDDPLHPEAYIGGDASGFIRDTDIVLRLRSATPSEDAAISDSARRKPPMIR